MAKGKKYITNNEEFREWVSSLGYLFPSNEKELARFNKFYNDYEHELSGQEIDPTELLDSMRPNSIKELTPLPVEDEFTRNWHLVARNRKSVSGSILSKMQKNQRKKTKGDK